MQDILALAYMQIHDWNLSTEALFHKTIALRVQRGVVHAHENATEIFIMQSKVRNYQLRRWQTIYSNDRGDGENTWPKAKTDSLCGIKWLFPTLEFCWNVYFCELLVWITSDII